MIELHSISMKSKVYAYSKLNYLQNILYNFTKKGHIYIFEYFLRKYKNSIQFQITILPNYHRILN